MFHDLKKLSSKPHGEFTAQDLKFVRNTVCPDGNCFNGSLNMTTMFGLTFFVYSVLFIWNERNKWFNNLIYEYRELVSTKNDFDFIKE